MLLQGHVHELIRTRNIFCKICPRKELELSIEGIERFFSLFQLVSYLVEPCFQRVELLGHLREKEHFGVGGCFNRFYFFTFSQHT